MAKEDWGWLLEMLDYSSHHSWSLDILPREAVLASAAVMVGQLLGSTSHDGPQIWHPVYCFLISLYYFKGLPLLVPVWMALQRPPGPQHLENDSFRLILNIKVEGFRGIGRKRKMRAWCCDGKLQLQRALGPPVPQGEATHEMSLILQPVAMVINIVTSVWLEVIARQMAEGHRWTLISPLATVTQTNLEFLHFVLEHCCYSSICRNEVH